MSSRFARPAAGYTNLAPSPSASNPYNYNTQNYYTPGGTQRWSASSPGIDETIPPAPQHAYVNSAVNHDDRYGFPSHPGRQKGGIWLYIFAVVIPPIPVFLRCGCHWQLLLNFILLLLGWIPAIIHAFYIIMAYEGPEGAPGHRNRGL